MVSSDGSSTNNDEEDDEEVPSSLPQPPLSTRPPLPPPRIRSTVKSVQSTSNNNSGARYSLRESPQRAARAAGMDSSKTLVGAKAAGVKRSSAAATTTTTTTATVNTSCAGTGTSSAVQRKKGLAALKLQHSQKRARAMVEESQVATVEDSEETLIEENQVTAVEMEAVVQGSVEEEVEEDDEEEQLLCCICHDTLGTAIIGEMAVEALVCGHSFHSVCISRHFAAQKERRNSARASARRASSKSCPTCRHVLTDSDEEEIVVVDNTTVVPSIPALPALPPLPPTALPAALPAALPPLPPTARARAQQNVARGGSARNRDKRGQGFSLNETENLLDIVQRFLPVSFRDWEQVAQAHQLQYPLHQRTGDSCRRKFQGLANKKPKTGESRPHPSVTKAKAIREQIAATNGSNTGEDDAVIEDFFEETEEQQEYELELQDIERTSAPPGPTPTFVRLSSDVSERSEMARQYDLISQGSAARELNPPMVPAPLSRGQFEVARRGSRLNPLQAQNDLFGNWAAMRQQMMDDERAFCREEALRRERREEEEQRRREEDQRRREEDQRRREEEQRRREHREEEEMRRREQERQDAAERRRDMMAMFQAALGVIIAANQQNGQQENQSNNN